MSETVELLFDVGHDAHPSDDPYGDADDLASALDGDFVLVDTYDGRDSKRYIGRVSDE